MLGERLGKPNLEIEVSDRGVRIPGERFDGVWSAFVHAVRNMVDHGIEPADARAVAGKPELGRITLETTVGDGELRLAIADDGAGIDWERIAAKARSLGLPVETRAQLEEALFASGVSTRVEVSDVSGRGIGMDALRAACREHGGRVEVESERGKGTRFTCVLPVTTRARRSSKSTSQILTIV